MGNPQLHCRIDRAADQMLTVIERVDGVDRATFVRSALANAMSGWLASKATLIRERLGAPAIEPEDVPPLPPQANAPAAAASLEAA